MNYRISNVLVSCCSNTRKTNSFNNIYVQRILFLKNSKFFIHFASKLCLYVRKWVMSDYSSWASKTNWEQVHNELVLQSRQNRLCRPNSSSTTEIFRWGQQKYSKMYFLKILLESRYWLIKIRNFLLALYFTFKYAGLPDKTIFWKQLCNF